MEDRIPVYEPEPRPRAMHSICSRSSPAWHNASSIIENGPRSPDSTTSAVVSESRVASSTATLRCPEENSSASIFIDDPALVFVERFDRDSKNRKRDRILNFCKPSLDPFDNRHAIRMEI